MFGVFDPAAGEDVLVPLGVVDGGLPGWTKYEGDQSRSAGMMEGAEVRMDSSDGGPLVNTGARMLWRIVK